MFKRFLQLILPDRKSVKGLIAFCEEHHPKKAIVVSLDSASRLLQVNENMSIHILPWRIFLEQLWRDKII